MTMPQIKKVTRVHDSKAWSNEVTQKKTNLMLYSIYKHEIREENDTPNIKTQHKCLSNILPLNDRNLHMGGDTECYIRRVCHGTETLSHFLLTSPLYQHEWIKFPQLQRPYVKDRDTFIGNLLFNQNTVEVEEVKKGIHNF